jgi:ferredoxin--NADP+ reductase
MNSDKFFEAELVERIDFTGDLGLFRFRADNQPGFKPGQYATIVLQDGDKLLQRPYSIVSAPHEPFLEFFLELVPHGVLTPRLWELREGSRVFVRNRIVGNFVLDESVHRHVMIATVTGIAPFLSMVRHAIHQREMSGDEAHEMLILHGASRSEEFGVYVQELKALAERHDWLHYVPTVSRPWEDTEWSGELGRVDDLVRKYADTLGFTGGKAAGYACGNPQMIETAKSILTRAGFPKQHIHEEKYFH